MILAAGMSRRLGRPKQLLPVGGKPLLRHVAERALASACDAVVVVVGHEAKAMKDALRDLNVQFIQNPDYREGMSTSLRAAVRELSAAVDGFVVLLSDQPEIEADAITGVVKARRATGAPVVVTEYGGEPRSPVLFGRETFPDLLMIRGDEGGRSVVRAYRERLVAVEGPAKVPPEDVDTEESYQALLARWTRTCPDL
ncbi:MAG: nucleotidyltransferase family protein [Chloroflexota bacterium]|nr:nucleotidyltransferase family protein [Chloroflexota bacterium]